MYTISGQCCSGYAKSIINDTFVYILFYVIREISWFVFEVGTNISAYDIAYDIAYLSPFVSPACLHHGIK